jgi:uncharacterized iron-regulated membrane protein
MRTLPSGRRLWLEVHLYLGLVAGVFFVVLGLTGSVLVFPSQIDRALNPQLATEFAGDAAPAVSPDDVLQVLDRALNERPYMLEAPIHAGDHYLAFLPPAHGSGSSRAVLVDAESGEIVADRSWGSFFVSFCRRLHTELFMGDAGNWVVGGIGVLGLVSILTGLYLWWPRKGAWRRALSFHWHRYPAAFNFELHRISGFYLLIVLFGVTASGVYLVMPEPFAAAVGAVTEVAPYPESVVSPVPEEAAHALTLADAARVVQQHSPAAVVTGFGLPKTPDQALTIYYRGQEEPHSGFGRSALWINPYTGAIMHVRDYAQMSTADQVFAWQILLHNGEFAGAAGEWLVFATGILMALLFGTGLYLWWVKRRPRRANAATLRSIVRRPS